MLQMSKFDTNYPGVMRTLVSISGIISGNYFTFYAFCCECTEVKFSAKINTGQRHPLGLSYFPLLQALYNL